MTEGKFRFRRCHCGQTRPHGFFYRPDGRKGISLFCSSLYTAIHFLRAGLRAGLFPPKQKTELLLQIKAAGLCHNPDTRLYDLAAWLLPERGCRPEKIKNERRLFWGIHSN